MIWRALVLTYPIWGSFIGFGLWSLLPRGSTEGEYLLLMFILPSFLSPLPIWMSPSMGGGVKIFLTLALYALAYVTFLVMRFGIACAVFRFSCAMD